MYMKLKDGKSKVFTLSYDDGVVQDIRLIKILNEHGLKGTFNINTGLLSESVVTSGLRRYAGCPRLVCGNLSSQRNEDNFRKGESKDVCIRNAVFAWCYS